MTDVQIKLNELISPSDITAKRRGSLYTLNNSLKRNTLYPLTLMKNYDIGYDRKLPHMNLKRKDLSKILELILSKEEMTLPDRNFLRRILVQIFDQQLICSGSRHFINHLKLLKQRAHDTITYPQKLFYFILKGSAIIKSCGFTYKIHEGSTFGEMELLSNEPIQSITYTEHTLIVTLDQMSFQNYFRYYFQKKYTQKTNHVSCIQEKYLQEIPQINRYFFLNHLQFETFNPGDKIIEIGKPVSRIYFVGFHWKGDMQSNLIDGCFGLKEIIKNKELYLQSAYSLDLGYRVPYVEKEIFVKYVKPFLNIQGFMGKSLAHTRSIVRNPEVKKSIGQVMNIKNVRIQTKSKKMHTEPAQAIISNFKFFKDNKLQASMSPKQIKMLLNNPKIVNLMYNKRKSQSIQLKTSSKNLL